MTRREVAIHEAAHAVIGDLLGVGIVGLSAEGDGKAAGHCSYQGSAGPKAFAVMVAAGEAAVNHLQGDIDRSLQEWTSDAGELAATIRPADRHRAGGFIPRYAARKTVADAIHDRAKAMVREHWSAIQRVASELEKAGTLTGQAFKAIVSPRRTENSEAAPPAARRHFGSPEEAVRAGFYVNGKPMPGAIQAALLEEYRIRDLRCETTLARDKARRQRLSPQVLSLLDDLIHRLEARFQRQQAIVSALWT